MGGPYCETCQTDRFHTHADYCCACGTCIKSDPNVESSLIEQTSRLNVHDWTCGSCIAKQISWSK